MSKDDFATFGDSIIADVLNFNPGAIPAPNTLYIRMTRGERRIAEELRKYFGGIERVVIDVDGEWHEFGADSLIRLLEDYEGAQGMNNHMRLFGTPERAARMLECSCHLIYGLKVDGFVSCIGCPVYDEDADVDDCCYDALLEWLRGDA